MYQADEEDLEIIKYQLGREPDNLDGIAKYCPFGKPAVLITFPYNKEKRIFPTTYWLSCPYLVKKVSQLESQGFIKDLTFRLKVDPGLKVDIEKAHYNYAQRRMSYLQDKEIEEIKKLSPDIFKVLKNSGVGGIREKEGIKCLHTHLADYMVNGQNPIGKIVSKMIEWPRDCKICEIGDDGNEDWSN